MGNVPPGPELWGGGRVAVPPSAPGLPILESGNSAGPSVGRETATRPTPSSRWDRSEVGGTPRWPSQGRPPFRTWRPPARGIWLAAGGRGEWRVGRPQSPAGPRWWRPTLGPPDVRLRWQRRAGRIARWPCRHPPRVFAHSWGREGHRARATPEGDDARSATGLRFSRFGVPLPHPG